MTRKHLRLACHWESGRPPELFAAAFSFCASVSPGWLSARPRQCPRNGSRKNNKLQRPNVGVTCTSTAVSPATCALARTMRIRQVSSLSNGTSALNSTRLRSCSRPGVVARLGQSAAHRLNDDLYFQDVSGGYATFVSPSNQSIFRWRYLSQFRSRSLSRMSRPWFRPDGASDA
jgi:hypothetical protein